MSRRPRVPVVFPRDAVRAVRPHADAFAEAALAGARRLTRWDEGGRLGFDSEPVAEIHQALREALLAGFAPGDRKAIEARSGRALEQVLDQVVLAWLRAEPALAELLLADPRGSGAFVFEVLRAELHDLDLDLVIEPRPSGYRIARPASRRRAIASAVAGAWLGAMAGFGLELAGRAGFGLLLFGAGSVLGMALGIRSMLGRGSPSCSECAAGLAWTAETCPRCGTRLLGDAPVGPLAAGILDQADEDGEVPPGGGSGNGKAPDPQDPGA